MEKNTPPCTPLLETRIHQHASRVTGKERMRLPVKLAGSQPRKNLLRYPPFKKGRVVAQRVKEGWCVTTAR